MLIFLVVLTYALGFVHKANSRPYLFVYLTGVIVMPPQANQKPALLTFLDANITVTSSNIQAVSTDIGAMICFENSTATLVNSVFQDNSPAQSSIIATHCVSFLAIVNCTFTSNSSKAEACVRS